MCQIWLHIDFSIHFLYIKVFYLKASPLELVDHFHWQTLRAWLDWVEFALYSPSLPLNPNWPLGSIQNTFSLIEPHKQNLAYPTPKNFEN